MEPQKSAVPKNAPLKKFWKSFEEIKAEFSRIQWSEEGEVHKTAKVVVVATFASGLVLYGADLILRSALHGLGALFQAIIG